MRKQKLQLDADIQQDKKASRRKHNAIRNERKHKRDRWQAVA